MKTASYETVRRLMFEKDIRKADVIRGAKISRPTLMKWERGEMPSLPTIKKVADYFGVSITEFLGE